MKISKFTTAMRRKDTSIRAHSRSPNLMDSISHPSLINDVILPFAGQGKRLYKKDARGNRRLNSGFLTDRKIIEEMIKSDSSRTLSKVRGTSRDISHLKDKLLVDAAGKVDDLLWDKKEYAFPTDSECFLSIAIKESKIIPEIIIEDWLGNDFIDKYKGVECGDQGFKNYKSIPGRQEAINLKIWFDSLKGRHLREQHSEKELIEFMGVIVFAVRELHEQISVACFERGQTFMDIFENYSKVINKCMEIQKESLNLEISRLNAQVARMKSKFDKDLQGLKGFLDDKKHQNVILLDQEFELKHQIRILQSECATVKQRFKRILNRRSLADTKKEADIESPEEIKKFNYKIEEKLDQRADLFIPAPVIEPFQL